MAQEYEYYALYFVGNSSNNVSGKTVFLTDSGATDGFDDEVILPAIKNNAINTAQYKINGIEGWNGITGLYMFDRRSPLLAGQSVKLDFYVWAGVDALPSEMHMHLSGSIPTEIIYNLRLVQIPDGITYTGPTQWNFEYKYIKLPFYSTNDWTTG